MGATLLLLVDLCTHGIKTCVTMYIHHKCHTSTLYRYDFSHYIKDLTRVLEYLKTCMYFLRIHI